MPHDHETCFRVLTACEREVRQAFREGCPVHLPRPDEVGRSLARHPFACVGASCRCVWLPGSARLRPVRACALGMEMPDVHTLGMVIWIEPLNPDRPASRIHTFFARSAPGHQPTRYVPWRVHVGSFDDPGVIGARSTPVDHCGRVRAVLATMTDGPAASEGCPDQRTTEHVLAHPSLVSVSAVQGESILSTP